VVLRCQKCNRAVEPTETMIVLYCGTVTTLEMSEAGLWHFRCAPQGVRRCVPAVVNGALTFDRMRALHSGIRDLRRTAEELRQANERLRQAGASVRDAPSASGEMQEDR
jgi:hypothetical protein